VVVYRVADGEARVLYLLFPHLRGLHLDQAEDLGGSVRIVARPAAETAACHGCGMFSGRVHGRYLRRLRDLACGGRPVTAGLEVRRFWCPTAGCEVRTFAEQADRLTQRHQQRTAGLRGVLEAVALAVAGRAGTRLAAALGVLVSRCTLIRLVRRLPDPEFGLVTVLGGDDFAKRRGQSYGTILVNMENHAVIDLLDDREAASLAGWLKAHPGTEVICRDRAGAYASGAREGAPDAQQVADRFHLWQNLGEAVEKVVIACRGDLREPETEPGTTAAQEPEEAPPPAGPAAPSQEPDGFRDACGRERGVVTRHRERHAAVHALLGRGLSVAAIGRELGLDRHTVDRFASAASIEAILFKSTHRAGGLDPFKPYLGQRWNAGVTNAAVLHAELQTRGWEGSVQAVRRYLRQFRPAAAGARQPGQASGTAPVTPPPPKPRRVVRWIMTRPDHLTDDDATQLRTILARSPQLDAAAQHVASFATMMTSREGIRLDKWIASVRASTLPALHTFASGLERDHNAVQAGLTLPYSSGAVEGHVCKVKMIKRRMYGRANFDLLRKMALHN